MHIAPRIDMLWYLAISRASRISDIFGLVSLCGVRSGVRTFGPDREKWCEGASERAAGPNESNLSECDATGRNGKEVRERTEED